jgi:hypothetical protein
MDWNVVVGRRGFGCVVCGAVSECYKTGNIDDDFVPSYSANQHAGNMTLAILREPIIQFHKMTASTMPTSL